MSNMNELVTLRKSVLSIMLMVNTQSCSQFCSLSSGNCVFFPFQLQQGLPRPQCYWNGEDLLKKLTFLYMNILIIKVRSEKLICLRISAAVFMAISRTLREQNDSHTSGLLCASKVSWPPHLTTNSTVVQRHSHFLCLSPLSV